MNVNGANYSFARGPWRILPTFLLSALVLFVFFMVQLVTTKLFLFGFALRSRVPPNPQYLLFKYQGLLESLAWLTAGPACIWMILYFIHKRKGPPAWLYLGVHPVRLRQMFVWLGVLVAFLFASEFLTRLLGKSSESAIMIHIFKTAVFPPLLWLVIVVIAPIFEEMLFRGFLYRGIEFSRLGPIGAVIITALCWSLIHSPQYDTYQVATVFAIGLLLGHVRARSGSIMLTIILHAANNLIAMIQLSYLVGHGS